MPELTQKEYSADGWFRTGDLGVISPAGYVTITGRSKDLVISGGYNVYPSEVENALNEMAAVRESAIVGTPDVDFGEAVVAFVIAADSDAPPTAAEVIGWAKQRLANYKVPKQVHVVDEFPRNAMGKVMKNQLRERLATIQRDV
jgi:malonyl-CoA/methylmalonyl-CoA synthetase